MKLGGLILAVWLAGCSFQSRLPPSVPELRYETPRAVVATIPEDDAREALRRQLARARAPHGGRLRHAVEETRFSFGWHVEFDGAPDEERHFEFDYAEVTAVVVDLSSIGGRLGVSVRRDGKDVPYAYFLTARLEDAETILDALAVLRGRR